MESHVGCKKKKNFKHISDPKIERMSKLQKDLSLQIEKSQNHVQIKQNNLGNQERKHPNK